MHCGRCSSESFYKSGRMNGRQRYRCRDCGYNFTRPHGRGFPLEMKLWALRLYKEGIGFRGIGRLLGVSNVTVLKWMRDIGTQLKQQVLSQLPADVDAMDIIEIDEMWHYIQKNSKNYGYGLLCLAPRDASSPLKWAVVAEKPSSVSGQGSRT
jgi:hypothetical protein